MNAPEDKACTDLQKVHELLGIKVAVAVGIGLAEDGAQVGVQFL